MRIATLHWGFPPIIGGVETHLELLLPQLVKMGHDVSLLTGSADGYPEQYDFEGVKIHRTKFLDLNWIFKTAFQEVDDKVYVIDEYIKETKPDIIHAHNFHYFSHYHANELDNTARRKKIPMILTAHNTWTDKLFLDLTTKISWKKIIAVSHYIKRELMAIGVPNKKIIVIHHGIDEKIFHPGKYGAKILKNHPVLNGKKNIILQPARMGLTKGCDISIEAFKLVKKEFPESLLVMTGSKNIIDWGLTQNKDIAFFISLAKRLGIEDSIYINAFSRDEMAELFRLADVIIYPSSADEPFGLAMLEAMASAKPIIVTESGGMPEIITNDVNGYVIPRRNHEELAKKIIKLLNDPSIREQLGQQGRRMVEEHYTKEIYAKKLIKVYEQVMD